MVCQKCSTRFPLDRSISMIFQEYCETCRKANMVAFLNAINYQGQHREVSA